jgi:hypothetical protein
VATIVEPAGESELGDVVECDIDAVVGAGDLERADTRRVDEEGAARQLEQLAVGRSMATTRVILTDGRGGLAPLT